MDVIFIMRDIRLKMKTMRVAILYRWLICVEMNNCSPHSMSHYVSHNSRYISMRVTSRRPDDKFLQNRMMKSVEAVKGQGPTNSEISQLLWIK